MISVAVAVALYLLGMIPTYLADRSKGFGPPPFLRLCVWPLVAIVTLTNTGE